MSKNIFLQKNQYVPKQKRNSYDLSKLVNGTYKEGIIYPVNWTEVTFGDSVRIDVTAALRTMPMVWPIQTPVLVKFYHFYVRYRTLWKNYTDFRFENRQHVHPYIACSATSDFWKTGGIADHMGVPTTLSSSNNFYFSPLQNPSVLNFLPAPQERLDSFVPIYRKVVSFGESPIAFPVAFSYNSSQTYSVVSRFFGTKLTRDSLLDSFQFPVSLVEDLTKDYVVYLVANLPNFQGAQVVAAQVFSAPGGPITTGFVTCDATTGSVFSPSSFDGAVFDKGLFGFIQSLDGTPYSISNRDYYLVLSDSGSDIGFLKTDDFSYSLSPATVSLRLHSSRTSQELVDSANPFSGSSPVIPLSSLPFRAYEACYRSHFQDLINEPFILDGVPQYNRYITNDGDGADSTDYTLFRRNWEADFLTSSKPSPQQGLAPLVGVTSSGVFEFEDQNGNRTTISSRVGDDGDTVEGFDLRTVTGEIDNTITRRLIDIVDSGFSINAFRNVNSYQRWKEANYRLGLKFREQVKAQTGVNLEYKELDMPEFLGGFTIPLNVNTVTQNASDGDNPVGTQRANASAFGRNKHVISHYCDEEGLIMTLMCITPIPVYSQLLPKTFLKQSPLDYYNAQFGKIGNQPVTYEEVCPIQAYNEGVDVHDVFGYQRPWYHLISSVDEAHGYFRTDMSQFLQMRVFGSTPQLGADFLHINSNQLNDVFVITDENVSDPYFGQIGFKIYKKTAIPRYNVPALE